MPDAAAPPVREPIFDFDYVADPTLLADIHSAYWRLKDVAPEVFWTPRNGGHWMVTSAQAAIAVLRRPEIFSNRLLSIPPHPRQQKMIPETLDPPEHRPYRELLRPYFEDKAIAPLAPRIEEWAERLIGSVADNGECEFVDELGSRFPLSVFMEMFGFPLDQLEHFRSLVVDLFRATSDEAKRTEVSGQIVAVLVGLIEARRTDPRNDLISTLVSVDFEGRKLTQEELISIGYLMFLAGLDTVVNALAFGMRHLAHDEALMVRLIEEPDSAPAIVEELMRRYAFVSVPRYVTQDTEVAGVRMRAGDSVLVPLAMVGWDEKTTSCPAEVRLDRPQCHHAAFGSGIHTCLGNRLARLEMAVFYRTWARRIGRFRMVNKGPLQFRGGNVQALEALHLQWGKSS